MTIDVGKTEDLLLLTSICANGGDGDETADGGNDEDGAGASGVDGLGLRASL